MYFIFPISIKCPGGLLLFYIYIFICIFSCEWISPDNKNFFLAKVREFFWRILTYSQGYTLLSCSPLHQPHQPSHIVLFIVYQLSLYAICTLFLSLFLSF